MFPTPLPAKPGGAWAFAGSSTRNVPGVPANNTAESHFADDTYHVGERGAVPNTGSLQELRAEEGIGVKLSAGFGSGMC